ncbi:nuclear transport factor 2 family protein [Paractinoplanes atraurantiacus]|uniref:SnoaL-like domain-containing protein n=1 Tax=Paractinoplanes atraurantiacus TaxID=1036182 RepID=A0A285IRI3_9ACTN|nr:nuclear transport factor 2 family protein [Actinoplanes atraurantiacus]SNY50574.1 SnoaL-like domain-containing protein [Actinoplanes atraurantiacus]
MSDFDTVVDRYLAVWNETDAAARRAAIDSVFAENVRYTDPLAAVAGRDALSVLIGGVHQQFPGLKFAPGGLIDGHHDQIRFTWTLGPAAGFDVAELDAQGRITNVLGFLDRV